jgi:hypothetical protein
MRIDEDASAKLWARRLRKLTDAIEADGGVVMVDSGGHCAVLKGESAWTTGLEDVSQEFK